MRSSLGIIPAQRIFPTRHRHGLPITICDDIVWLKPSKWRDDVGLSPLCGSRRFRFRKPHPKNGHPAA